MFENALARLAKGSLIYGIGGVLQKFIGFFLLPFFTRALNPEDYGVYALVSLIAMAINGFLTLGTGNSIGILYFQEENTKNRPSIIWTCILILLTNGIIWYFLIFITAPYISQLIFQTDEYENLIRISLFGAVLGIILDPWLAYLRMEEQAKKYVILTVLGSLISIFLSIYFVLFLEAGIKGLIISGAISQFLMFFILLFTIGRQVPFEINKKYINPLIRIGFPSIFGLFAFFIIDYADRQMIERIMNLDTLGIYSIGYNFGMIIMLAVGAFSTAWPPFFNSYVNKIDQAKQVFPKVFTFYILIIGILSILFFSVSKPLIYVMTPNKFHDAWLVVGFVASGYALKGCYLILLPGIYFSHKLHWQSVIEWIAAAINISMNIILIPILGILGAAIATFFSYLSLSIITFFISQNLLVVNYEWKKIFTYSALTTMSCVIIFLNSLINFENIFKNISESLLVIIIFLLITYNFFFSTSEKRIIKSKLRL